MSDFIKCCQGMLSYLYTIFVLQIPKKYTIRPWINLSNYSELL